MKNSIKKAIVFFSFSLVLVLFSTISLNAQDMPQAEKELVYMKIEVKGLACPYCAYGMERELKQIPDVKDIYIELKTGMAYIATPADKKPTKEELTKIVDDGGFTAGEVEYSDHPFEIKKKKRRN